MKRRDLLVRSAIGLTAVTVALPLVAREGFPETPFTLGIASGDVTESSVVLWTRLALEPLAADGGIKQIAVPVGWELALDAGMKNVVKRGEALAVPELAHSVHVELEGLGSDQEYWYRFFVATHCSEVGRTKTLPSVDSHPASIRFVTASCQNYTHGHFVAYDHIVADKPDFVIHLGDYIYDNSFGQTFRKHDTDTGLYTLAEFRRRHALYKTDKHLRKAHAQVPFFSVLDNHDAVTDNDPAALAQRTAAYQAWYEHMPTRGYCGVGSNQFRLHRKIELGKLLQISLLDTRQFRDTEDLCKENSDPAYGFGNYREPCRKTFDEGRSMLGKVQERWLRTAITSNKSAWHAIASTGPFTSYSFYKDGKILNYIGSWDGYPANRKRIVDAISAAKMHDTVILSGDVHSFWAFDGNQFEASTDRVPVVEFVTSSITADWPEPLAKPVTDSLRHNPQIQFYDPQKRGYLLHEITASEWQTTARAIKDVRNDQSEAFDLARFVVAYGKPGFKRIL